MVLPAPHIPIRSPGIRRLKRRTTTPKLRPLPSYDPILRSQEQQLEEEFLRWSRGTRPEYTVWRFLVYTKKQIEGTDFYFQSSRFGGRQVLGGVVVDFWLPSKFMMWRVQGERFHLMDPQDRVRDMVARIRLEGEGFTVIDLWVRDLETRPEYVLELAWEGREPPSRMRDL